VIIVLTRGNERRDGVHVGGQHDQRIAKPNKDIVAVCFDGHALEVTAEGLRHIAQAVRKKISNFTLVRRYRLDIDETPR
jgi:hypothetical protein